MSAPEDFPPEVKRMAAATMRALDSPEGEAVLDGMTNKTISVEDGLVKLALLSGEYELRTEEE